MQKLMWLWRQRWFGLAVVCVGLNAWGVARWSAGGRAVVVRSFSAGESGVVSGRDLLVWRFSAPVVAPALVGRWDIPDILDLAPQTPGRLRWRSPRELTFEPLGHWPSCTPFTAVLRDDAVTPSGRSLDVPEAFTFASESLRLIAVRECDTDEHGRSLVELRFNAPPKSDALAGFLTFRDPAGEKVRYTVLAQPPTTEVRVRLEPTGDQALTVAIGRGLPPEQGPRGTSEPIELPLVLSPKLVLGQLRGESPAFGDCRIIADFNGRVDSASAAASIRVIPPVPFAVVTADGWQQSSCILSGAFVPGHAYRVQVAQGLKAVNGRILETAIDQRLVMPHRPSGIRIDTTGYYRSPRGSMKLPIVTSNVDTFTVTAERVHANNLVQYWMRRRGRYANYYHWRAGDHANISAHVGEATYKPGCGDGTEVRTLVDLRGLFASHATGAFFVRAIAGDDDADQLVAVTDTGIAAVRGADDLLVWANSLHTLAPITGAVVRVFSTANQELAAGVSDTNGLVRLTGAFDAPANEPFLVTVDHDGDLAFLCLDDTSVPLPGDIGGAPYAGDAPEAFVYTDRGIYRPGETGHVAAVVRDARLACTAPFPVTVQVNRPDGVSFLRTNQVLSAEATIAVTFPIAAHAMTGRYTCQALLPDGSVLGRTGFLVEEFIPPRIKTDVAIEQARVRDRLSAVVSARYLFGRVAAGLPATVSVVLRPQPFSAPQWPGYCFADTERSVGEQTLKLGTKALGEQGTVRFETPVPALKPASAMQALVCTTVQETNGRTVAAYRSAPVDCYARYVGVRLTRADSPVRAGQASAMAVALVQPDGTAAAGVTALVGRLSRVTWTSVLEEQDDGTRRYRSERHLDATATLAVVVTNGIGACTVTPPVDGQYLFQVEDGADGASASLSFYVSTAGGGWQPWAQERPGVVELTLDKEAYAPGDEATLVVKSPFAGRALIAICTDRVLDTRVVELAANTATIFIPVRDTYGPNAYCIVSVIRPVSVPLEGDETRTAWAPHRAVGVVPLVVTDDTHRLAVTLDAPLAIAPAGPLTVRVAVRDAHGAPAQARLTLAAIDEGICLLTAFTPPDPFAFFRRKRACGGRLYDIYSLLMPEVSEVVQGDAAAPGGDDGASLSGRLNPIRARRYVPTALWVQDIRTDAAGSATVTFDVPEFTGQLRVMAVAAGSIGVGSAVAPVAVKRSIVVMSSLPRFLAPGDVCELPIHVLNESAVAQTVALRVTADGPLAAVDAGGPAGMPAGKRPAIVADLEVSCSPGQEGVAVTALTALARPGVARVMITARTNGVAFFSECTELAVRPASPRVSVVTNGCLVAGAQCRIPLQHGWLTGTDTHTVTSSGLPVPQLAGALDYLLRYPYGCLEQTTSTALPLLYAGALLRQCPSLATTSGGVESYVNAGISRVLSMQRREGDFAYWPQGGEGYRWGTVYATHFLVEARAAGYRVPDGPFDAALGALAKMLEQPLETDVARDRYWLHGELGTRAYACYVLALAGRAPEGWIARLQELTHELNGGARGLLAAALTATGRRREAHTLLSTQPEDDAATVIARLSGDLNSPARGAAMLLSAWLDIDPADREVARLAQRLLREQRRGRWRSTQENAYALLALGKYCARALGDAGPAAGTVSWDAPAAAPAAAPDGMRGVSVAVTGNVAIAATPAAGVQFVTITNAGPAALYWSVVSSGVASNAIPEAVDDGLAVRRDWLDAAGRPLTGPVARGELVVARITIGAQTTRVPNIAVQDLLPAGLEIENTRLATSELLPWAKVSSTLQPRHVEVRDDRLLLFLGELGGSGTYYYTARAITPGDYVMPPITADCMYDESIRSVGAAGRFVVQESGAP